MQMIIQGVSYVRKQTIEIKRLILFFFMHKYTIVKCFNDMHTNMNLYICKQLQDFYTCM